MTKTFERIIAPLFLMLCALSVGAAGDLKTKELTCEYRINPLGIDVSKPGFSWTLISSKRNQMQSAYEIIISEKLKEINNLRGTVWASGHITNSQSLQVEYGGAHLSPFTRYYWKVRVFDGNNRPSEWSKTAWFETATLKPGDWKAKWIGDGREQFKKDEDFYQNDPMPLFKKVLKVKKHLIAARLYISGLGYYEAYLNGKKIGNNVLDPGFTSYRKQVLYTAYDITDSIRNGKNVLSVMLGNGWYNPLPIRLFGTFNLRDAQQTGRPCFTAMVSLKYSDGSTDEQLTDNSWLTATGQIVFNNVYLGEHDDGRLERNDFFSEKIAGWKSAAVTTGPDGNLSAQMQPPIRITRIVYPISIKEAGKDTFIVDMGQNFAGVARIKVKGNKGSQVKLRYGEALFANGQLNYLTTVAGQIKEIWRINGGPGSPKTAWQEDSYILKGEGTEVWSPRFTFHGFRYVQITGWPGKPELKDIEGLRMNADLQQDGSFSCSNDLFNHIHEVAQWTFLSNVFSVQSDCPGREKMGYGADMVVTSQSYAYNYNMSNFYRKSVKDFANDQAPDGGITEISPYTGIHSEGAGGNSGPVGWQLAFPYLQMQLYNYYGDKRIIQDNYPALARQINFLKSKAYDNLFDNDIGDHAAIDAKPIGFDASLFYYHHVLLAADFAGILGKKQDSLAYRHLAANIKRSIIARYEVPGSGRFGNATQGAQIFALWYNLPADTQQAYHILTGELKRHKYHVSTGIFSTKMLFDLLEESYQPNLAYKIVNQPDYPGWGYMLAKNATTFWESWDYPDNSGSQNHPMFGSVEEWFYRGLLGINQAAPGFKKIVVKPQPPDSLSWAKGSYNSVSGNITCDWQKKDDKFLLHVVIPVNTTAEVWVPVAAGGKVEESGKDVNSNSGFKLLRYEHGYAIIATGSGDYDFTTRR